jgi:hypothetical protein
MTVGSCERLTFVPAVIDRRYMRMEELAAWARSAVAVDLRATEFSP